MTAFSEKNCGDAINTLVCTRGKEITKKIYIIKIGLLTV